MHADCLQAWVNASNRREPMRCEVCLQPYRVRKAHRIACVASKLFSCVACAEGVNLVFICLVLPTWWLVIWFICATNVEHEAHKSNCVDNHSFFVVAGALILAGSLITIHTVYQRWKQAVSVVTFR